MSDEISYEGIDENTLLWRLYHGTRPLGLGFLHDRPDFSPIEAAEVVAHAREHAPDGLLRFDYVAGRPIKVSFDTNTKTIRRAALYDRDAGSGACQRVVDEIRSWKDY